MDVNELDKSDELEKLIRENRVLSDLLLENIEKQRVIIAKVLCNKLGISYGDTIRVECNNKRIQGVFKGFDFLMTNPNSIIVGSENNKYLLRDCKSISAVN